MRRIGSFVSKSATASIDRDTKVTSSKIRRSMTSLESSSGASRSAEQCSSGASAVRVGIETHSSILSGARKRMPAVASFRQTISPSARRESRQIVSCVPTSASMLHSIIAPEAEMLRTFRGQLSAPITPVAAKNVLVRGLALPSCRCTMFVTLNISRFGLV